MRIANTVSDSIVDGPGLRFTVFTQGCPHHCPGCHNPDTHDPAGGREVSLEELMAELDSLCGLEQVKADVKSLINLVKVRKLREEHGSGFKAFSYLVEGRDHIRIDEL